MLRMENGLGRAFFDAVEGNPGATAFRCRGIGIDYASAAAEAGRLAAVLAELGVEPGDRVGLFMFKCLRMPLSLYGVLTAGAAYVPLDPATPPARLAAVIEDCGIEVLIADRHTLATVIQCPLHEQHRVHVISVEDEYREDAGFKVIPWRQLESASERLPDNRRDQDLAYIMYTSGSTGTPKGLTHTHGSGAAYVMGTSETYGFRAGDRFGNHSPLHFDMSTLEMLTAPCVGATSVLITEDCMRLAASMAELVEAERLTVWYSVPFPLIQMLLHGDLRQRDFSSLNWVLFGGEPFPVNHLAKLMDLWPECRFSNVYGPAEINQCSFYHVERGALERFDSVPLGRIWSRARGRIVDAKGGPASPGETGELLVAAPSLMSGYWNRPDLDRESFVTVQDDEDAEERRYYGTGDLVYEQEGLLFFAGRKDRQIKLRGFRIELDEVEGALYADPAVAEAAAFLIQGPKGEPMLAAAVIQRQRVDQLERRLRRSLRGQLPAYAIPERIFLCEEFPRTGSNKIDRRTLSITLSEAQEVLH